MSDDKELLLSKAIEKKETIIVAWCEKCEEVTLKIQGIDQGNQYNFQKIESEGHTGWFARFPYPQEKNARLDELARIENQKKELRHLYSDEQKAGPVDPKLHLEHYWALEGRIKQINDALEFIEKRRQELKK